MKKELELSEIIDVEIIEERSIIPLNDSDNSGGNVIVKNNGGNSPIDAAIELMGVAIIIGVVLILALFAKNITDAGLWGYIGGVIGVMFFIRLMLGSRPNNTDNEVATSAKNPVSACATKGVITGKEGGNTFIFNDQSSLNIGDTHGDYRTTTNNNTESHIGAWIFIIVIVCILSWAAWQIFVVPPM